MDAPTSEQDAVPEPDEVARAFEQLFRRMEHAMKRCGFCQDHKDNAEADWDKLAKTLGEEFYKEVAASRQATALLAGRPRKLKRLTLTWQPNGALPINNVKELFVNGICQVRNNLFHGEKFRGNAANRERDIALIVQSTWVLELVLGKLPKLREHL